MHFPLTRMQRLRQTQALRDLVGETSLSIAQIIQPLFIRHGKAIKKPISSMPGFYQLSVDHLAEELDILQSLGIQQVLLFGIPETKDAYGISAWDEQGIIPKAIAAIKAHHPHMVITSDVCFCEYTDHGHCGYLHQSQGIDNDATLEALVKQAISHAQAGADIIAPSGMMDGMVQAIRQGLDSAGFWRTPILSYSVKYASSFYGPFREAAEGAPQFGDRRHYQMDYRNIHESLRECGLDVQEGADMLMVKPAHTYLDIITRVKAAYPAIPLGAYHTSGEFAMLKAAAEKGWINEEAAVLEIMHAIKRAGADFIITYYAKQLAQWLS